MPDSKTVAQYLPFLRRYARALTGSQTSGDAYVAATLEALIADPAIINDEGGPRVALYRLFTKIWNSITINGAAGAGRYRPAGRAEARQHHPACPARPSFWSRSKASPRATLPASWMSTL